MCWERLIKSATNVSKFDSKWARGKLQTASLLSHLCSEIISDQINGRLATQRGKPSSGLFSLTLPELILSELIIMNHYLWMRGNLFSVCGWEPKLKGLARRCSTLPSVARPVKWFLCCWWYFPPSFDPAKKELTFHFSLFAILKNRAVNLDFL